MLENITNVRRENVLRAGIDDSAVRLESASKSYGSLRALEETSLEVQPGEILALLGPNGAGKTTAVSLMLGLRAPSSGRARIFGRDPREPASRKRVGAMLQESGVPETLKVREVVEMFRRLYEKPLPAREALEAAGLDGKAGSKVGRLSGGERQRLYFALCIVGDPDLLFLDETTVGLDVESRRWFWERIQALHRRGKTIVLTHYLEEADALAERVVIIGRGRIIAEGTPAEIKGRVGGKFIRFKSPGLEEAALHSLPHARTAERRDEGVEIYSTEPGETLEELFRRGVKPRELEVVGAGLEQAFVALTGDKGQEDWR